MLCLFVPKIYLSSQPNVDSPDNITEEFFRKQHSIEQLNRVLDLFDTYDYVRTKDQREELVSYLLNEFKRHDNSIGIAKCSNILGVLKRDQASYAEAIELHESALNLAGSDTIVRIYSLNNLGVVYRRMDKPRLALDYHMEALELAEEYRGNPITALRSKSVALNSIGNINLTLNQAQKALEVFRQTLVIERRLNNGLGLAINYQNIGYAHNALGRPDSALFYYKKSLQENELVNSYVGQSICHNSIGELLLRQKEANRALLAFREAMLFSEKTNDKYYIAQSHANLGKAYLALNAFDSAYSQLNIYMNMAADVNSGYLVQNSYNLMSEYYEKTNQYSKALEYYKIAVQYNDSILNEKNARYLNEIQVLYDSRKQQQQIELLTVENQVKTQQNYISLFVVVLLFLIGLVINISLKRKADARNSELESRLFRSLMNPHFIFNALGSIQSFLYKNEPDKAANYLGHFSKLARSILQNSNKDLITLEEELQALRYYLEIEQMRQDFGFTYEIIKPEELEVDFIYVPPTIIQPFVENSIMHGINCMKAGTGHIKIELKQLDKYLRIVIIDNGKGINSSATEESSSDHKSMGLNIFKERSRIIQKKYKKTVIFEINDLEEIDPGQTGTIVTIEFPLIEPND